MFTKTLMEATKGEAVLTLEQMFQDDGTSFLEPGKLNFLVSFRPHNAALGALEFRFEFQNEASRFFRLMFKKHCFNALIMDPEYYLYLTMDWSEDDEEEEHYYNYFC